MPTWSKSAPKPNAYHCDTFWHLRKSGNLLALYSLIGNVTKGGATTFFGSLSNVTRYFFPDANEKQFAAAYETVRKSFHALRKLGWLKARPDGKWEFVNHDEWESEHTGKCFKRVVVPWQDETDSLTKQLYALSHGKLRVMQRHMAAIRKVGTDYEIIEAFAVSMKEAEKLREQKAAGSSPRQSFWRAYRALKARKSNPTPKLETELKT